MPVQAGKKYYFVTHAYHHVVAEVVEITGKREADVRNAWWIYSCDRNWEEFFRDGFQHDTTKYRFPDGSITWIDAWEWHHEIRESTHATSRQPRR